MVLSLYREDPPGEEMTRAKIRGTARVLGSRPEKGDITLFCVDEAVVGYAIVAYCWSNEFGGDIARLDELYVRPPWRGQGIATAFLTGLGSEGERDVRGVELEVTPGNGSAFDYYVRRGFALKRNRHLFKRVRKPGTASWRPGA